ncbi:MAG TPA: hypothetical protein VGO50_16685 [Pyrinomonadaceae bacterium]|jgi:hypothetical protein|nr:hypothetical protein [Pyrinomonadaceae bacterium]
MLLRIIKFSLLILLFYSLSCREPQKAELKAYLPNETLIYLETDDLSKVSAVFTGNRYWQSLSDQSDNYLSFLKNKQAALAVTGFENTDEGAALQVRPNLALAIDTGSSGPQVTATAEKILRELSRRFSGGEGAVEKQTAEDAQWMSAPGSDDKKIYAAVSGAVVVIANNEKTLRQCLDLKQGKGESLRLNKELLEAKEQYGAPDQIAFGYVSAAGVKELSNYLSVSYALRSSENSLTREMISGILPDIMQKTIGPVAWSARAVPAGVEDTYFIKTEKEFAGTVFQTVKASVNEGGCDPKYLPEDIFSTSCYRLEEPRLAWRGAVLSLAKQLDPKTLGLFEQFSRQLLKPYGIDDPELFLSAVGPQIITARFDADGDSAAAIVKIADKEKLKQAISETFDLRKAPEISAGAEVWKSKDGEFAAAFLAEDLIIGNTEAIAKCLQAGGAEKTAGPETPSNFTGSGAIVVTRQKDDSAVRILSEIAAERGKTVEVTSYAFIETRIEPRGIKRRSISAFGLFGEIFRQAIE